MLNKKAALKEIGQTIRELRLKKGLTQEQLSGDLNVTFRMLQKWEKGAMDYQITTLYRIAQALECDLQILIKSFLNPPPRLLLPPDKSKTE